MTGIRDRRVTLDEAALERLRAAAQIVMAGRPDVVAAWLHGSAGRAEPAGDLDVAVLFDRSPTTWSELSELSAGLAAAAGPLPVDLDLRPLNDTGPRFEHAVLRDGVLLFERTRADRIAYQVAATSRWLDFKPVWERERRRWLAQVASGG